MRLHVLLAFSGILLSALPAVAQEMNALPNGAALRIGVHRLCVAGGITDFGFTPDHRTLVVAYDESDPKKFNVVLFDVATGLERKRLKIRGAAPSRHGVARAVARR